ncbi:hypothetical protein J7382_06835 [Shimia sp. R11_0]|uniref:hypothetical protein n=1 Tax=Shimia sp. R11_0 TaxID=2821096 RepID=UPI001AD99220|nr:hypothetical protein [Shimia sp. R11_0]MBO9477243.1 hypothetical protein [Shimia sp. R11_0]
MQIVLHAGAHFTDDGKLLGSLAQNTELMAQHGIALPPPSTYRRQIRDTLGQMSNAIMATDYKGAVMGGMIGDATPDRMVLSNDNFFGVPRRAIKNNLLFPTAGDRLRGLCSLFYGEDIEVFLALRNPATFLPALVDASPNHAIEEVTDNCDPTMLRWSELILRIREAVPHVPITVWCNEDTPLIWEEVMREMAGLDHNIPMAGSTDLLREIMSKEGMARLEAFLAEHQGVTEIQKRRVIAAFLDKFALEDQIEEELDLPGWTATMVDQITDAYDEDVFQIERIPGVTLITP